jgi:YqaJ-like viral recombinase domain
MIEIINCDQGTEAWYRARAGIPTASEFQTLLAKGRGGSDSKGRRTYMMKLAGEILTGEPMESFSSVHMDRGKAMEEEARGLYAMVSNVAPEIVGFLRNGDKGCSPDSLIGERGLLEIKTALPHILIETLLQDEFPNEHKAQTQGQLWVAERDWVDLMVYWPGLPPFIRRAYRDEAYIADLAIAVKRFNEDLAEMVALLRSSYSMLENPESGAAVTQQCPEEGAAA